MAADSMIRIKNPMIDEFQFRLKSESTAQPADYREKRGTAA